MKPEEEHSFFADEIIPNLLKRYSHDTITVSINNLIFKKNKKYGIASIDGKIVLPADYDLIISSDALKKDTTGNIGIIWKDGKCSFVCMDNGIILEPFKYDDIVVNDSNSNEWLVCSTYMVKEKGKCGCLNFDREIILPIIYDSIDFRFENDSNGYHYKMLLYKDGKIGTYEYCNYGQYTNNYHFHEIELEFTVKPDYDECVFLNNRRAVNSFKGMSYIAVRKGNKWGIIDNTPASATYFPADETYWIDEPNLIDLEFKYNSLEELKNDADSEFSRRYKKYERPHMISQFGNSLIVSEFD